jgi:hypothetical protein
MNVIEIILMAIMTLFAFLPFFFIAALVWCRFLTDLDN